MMGALQRIVHLGIRIATSLTTIRRLLVLYLFLQIELIVLDHFLLLDFDF